MRGPSWTNLDLSLFRTFQVSEDFGVEFRSEFFNITNTPKFGNPNGNASSSAFGEVRGTASFAPSRVIRFAGISPVPLFFYRSQEAASFALRATEARVRIQERVFRRKTEERRQKKEERRKNKEDRRKKTEGRRQKEEDRRKKTEGPEGAMLKTVKIQIDTLAAEKTIA